MTSATPFETSPERDAAASGAGKQPAAKRVYTRRVGGFRDDSEAVRARNEALEIELAEANRKLGEAQERIASLERVHADLVEAGFPVAPVAAVAPQDQGRRLPAEAITALAYSSPVALLLGTPLLLLLLPKAWLLLTVPAALAMVCSAAHMRQRKVGRTPRTSRTWHSIMSLVSLVAGPVGLTFPTAALFEHEYARISLIPYALTNVAFVLAMAWFGMLAPGTLPGAYVNFLLTGNFTLPS